jgi:hypothetical protein
MRFEASVAENNSITVCLNVMLYKLVDNSNILDKHFVSMFVEQHNFTLKMKETGSLLTDHMALNSNFGHAEACFVNHGN